MTSPSLTPAALSPASRRSPRGSGLSAWLTLLRVSVQQIVRGRRLLALAALFALPALLGGVERYYNPDHAEEAAQSEELLVFYMIPQALVPLTALILASGMVRDEVEGQTLTYLLVRPLPRPSIYVAKLLAAWFVASALTAVFVTVTEGVIYWGAADFWSAVMPARAFKVAALSALSLLVYLSLFGALSLVVRWVLPLGVAYTAVIEGLFANIDLALRRVTVLYYVRVLAERWLGLHVESWSIRLDEAPGGPEALATLLGAALVAAVGAAWWFGTRELRVKTPEGS